MTAGRIQPAELSRELREGNGVFLRNRRTIAALSVAAAGSMGLVMLFQMGVVKRFPRGAARVNGSAGAYSHFATPDGALGLLSYAVTAALAAAGPRDRARRMSWLPVALAGKAALDASAAAVLTAREVGRYRALCLPCLVSSAAAFAALPLAIPEARAAWKGMR